nr:gene transfer agent family protein [uncultured Cohaesibacter sp.]
MNEFRAFFGDKEHVFAIKNREMIEELEKQTAKGIGSLFRSFRDQTYEFADLMQVLRVGLIGGGLPPATADHLVNTYGVARPIAETIDIADGTVTALFFGDDEAPSELAADMAEAYADETGEAA